MKLTILGMNGPFPAAGGATSAYLVAAGSTLVQLDAGTGSLAALLMHTAPESLRALVLSHWHFDHCSDLLPMLYRLESAGGSPLDVYAPVDEASPVRQAALASKAVAVHDVHPGDSLCLGELQLTVGAARHPVPAVMYRLQHEGRTLCYTGDTNTIDGLTDFVRGADLLLADGLFPAALWAEGKPHLSAELCARIAAEAGVPRLIVTHLNPLLDPATLLKEARALHGNVSLAACGDSYSV